MVKFKIIFICFNIFLIFEILKILQATFFECTHGQIPQKVSLHRLKICVTRIEFAIPIWSNYKESEQKALCFKNHKRKKMACGTYGGSFPGDIT